LKGTGFSLYIRITQRHRALAGVEKVIVLKGRGFSHAIKPKAINAALAAEGMIAGQSQLFQHPL
jgi:hypothetical protein